MGMVAKRLAGGGDEFVVSEPTLGVALPQTTTLPPVAA
jgi:hypothetical protein